jgi:hypothetical protein
MPVSHEAAPRGKTSRHLKFKAPHPGWSRIDPPVDTSSACRAVYSGSVDRIGSYGPHFGGWLARNRHGTPIGIFDSPAEAISAISAAAGAR